MHLFLRRNHDDLHLPEKNTYPSAEDSPLGMIFKKVTKDILLHPGRLTWNLQITHLEGKMIFQASKIMFHVNLQGV